MWPGGTLSQTTDAGVRGHLLHQLSYWGGCGSVDRAARLVVYPC